MNAEYGRDRRRRLGPDEQRFLYERADGLCQKCGAQLDSRWHAAHLVSYTHGGATSVEQMEAWCWPCNLRQGPRDAANAPAFTPRLWQDQALPRLLEEIWHNGMATLHAAPGAGKTFETAWAFQRLYDAGLVRRLLVVVPSVALVGQWVEELGKLGVHLDKEPRNGVIELDGTVGAAVCYASLRQQTARAHATRMDRIPTLVAWDEVHHLADKAAWGDAARLMVGLPGQGRVEHAAAVLNITGTLFRSSARQRIATVEYRNVSTDEGEKIQAVATYSVTTADLVGSELRGPQLYVYSGRAEVVDLRTEDVVTGEIADLAKQERAAVMRESFTSRQWLRGFCQEALVLLRRQQLTPAGEKEPLKLLYVAQNQNAAKLAADMLNELTGENFARLVISDEPRALVTLRAAKRERRSCAIVAVQMVTEGFDCNHIAVTAYAANKIAPLFIAQVQARNMRVTATERAERHLLPAPILIPDNPDLRKAFASAMAAATHEVEAEDTCGRCGLPRETCDCPPGPGPGGPGQLPRYRLLSLDDPQLRSAIVLGHEDGEVDGIVLNEQWIPACADLNIPEIYAPNVAVAASRVRTPVRIYAEEAPASEPEVAADPVAPPSAGPVRVKANPRDVNKLWREERTQAAKWMAMHVAHDPRWESIRAFQSAANDAGTIGYDRNGKGLSDLASSDQMARTVRWMRDRIAEHLDRHHCSKPKWWSEQ